MAPQNRLAQATSPYLRQHADNPVDWYVWGPEALARAKAEDKPILLSVGYSACHWCHVMAHESFENPATAALMNEHFINIKVDREERPDIDEIYQKVVALMGQGGGWPLTVFLTPDQRPFYGGTYFPPDDRYGRPGFPRLLRALSELWTERRDAALEQADTFMSGFADLAKSIDEDAPPGIDLTLSTRAAWTEAGMRLAHAIDPEWGGLGRAPKFPNVPSLRLLLGLARDGNAAAADEEPVRATAGSGTRDGSARHGGGAAKPRHEATAALRLTLEKMWRGGIYDHLRGGFARYSTDREWLIPHFEKMLYDNALLLELYAEASLLFPRDVYMRRVVEQTADYLVADMRSEHLASPGGPRALGGGEAEHKAFYSATDADSEGVEGKYFCWTPAQLEEALGEALGHTFARAHGVTPDGNFEHGMSVLHLPHTIPPALELELVPARAKLLELRYGRVPPLRDDKLLTAWNALAISGFCAAACAAQVWGDERRAAQWTAVAEAACDGIWNVHRDAEGRLLRASWAGQGHTRAYLEDVALLARACLDLHELTLEPRWHEQAESLAREILEHYRREGGGLYTTADDAEQLIERSESSHDSPLQSGLAASIEVLARLDLGGPAGHEPPAGTREVIEQTLSRFAKVVARPSGFAGLIEAAQWAGDRAVHVTIRAKSPSAGQMLAGAVRRARSGSSSPIAISYVQRDADADAIVCRAQSCSMPVSDAQELVAQLRG
jgi:uncharacterized protein YyaL (SSP411 family)